MALWAWGRLSQLVLRDEMAAHRSRNCPQIDPVLCHTRTGLARPGERFIIAAARSRPIPARLCARAHAGARIDSDHEAPHVSGIASALQEPACTKAHRVARSGGRRGRRGDRHSGSMQLERLLRYSQHGLLGDGLRRPRDGPESLRAMRFPVQRRRIVQLRTMRLSGGHHAVRQLMRLAQYRLEQLRRVRDRLRGRGPVRLGHLPALIPLRAPLTEEPARRQGNRAINAAQGQEGTRLATMR